MSNNYLNNDSNTTQKYIDTLINVTKESKYRNLYLTIINTALSRATSREEANKKVLYTESHHILPKSFRLGGSTDENNLVYLTPLEHYLVHRMLPKFTIDRIHTDKMLYASTQIFKSRIHPDRVEKTPLREIYCKRALKLKAELKKEYKQRNNIEENYSYLDILNAKIISEFEVDILFEIFNDLKKELPMKYLYRLKRYFIMNQFNKIDKEIIETYIEYNTLSINKIELEHKIGIQFRKQNIKISKIKRSNAPVITTKGIKEHKSKLNRNKNHEIVTTDLETLKQQDTVNSLNGILETRALLKTVWDKVIEPIENVVNETSAIESIKLIKQYKTEFDMCGINCRSTINHSKIISGIGLFLIQFGFKLEKIKQSRTTGKIDYRIIKIG